MSGIDFWVNNPNFRLFPPDANQPAWCEQSLLLVEWGDNLLARLARDPLPGKIGFAKWKLLDRYARQYFKTKPEHWAETTLDNHPCLHQALLEIWQKLEDVELQAAIPELEPPPVQVITPAVEPPAEVIDEDTGIIIGQDTEDAEDDES